MRTPLLIHKNLFNQSFLIFLNNISGCKICELYDEKKSIRNRIIFTPYNFNKSNLDNFVNWCEKNLQEGSIIFCSKSISGISKFSKYYLIYYPVSILDFEKIIFNYREKDSLEYSTLFLGDNILQNSNNNKTVNLTDTEQEIVKILFEKKRIERSILETKVLHFVEGTESKSLDSHLVRIRKKIHKINGSVLVSSVDSKYIVLEKN